MRVKRAMNTIMNRLKCCKGLSLVEIMVTLLIFVVLAAAINTVMLIGQSSWQTNSVQVELQQDLRKAMDWMKDELRQTGSAAISGGPDDADDTWYTSITFQTATGINGSSIEWGGGDPDATTQFILGGANNNQLQRIIRDNDGNVASTTVIAQNIQLVQFRRLSAASNVIEVDLDAQKDTIKGNTITANLDFKVQMRN